MLTRPTTQQLQALAALKGQGHWSTVNSYIEAELQAIFKRMLDTSDLGELQTLRGMAKFAKAFQQQVADASAQLAKSGAPKPL
jgi:hypothetical protein